MDWLNPVKWFDSITNTVFDALNFNENKEINDKNYEMAQKNYQLQVDTLNYQKELQQKIFDREDTAVQRKKADLIAAGMNPLLAAGQGAGAGSVVPVMAPQNAPQKQPTLFNDGIGQGISKTIDEMIKNQKIGSEIDQIQANESFIKANEHKINEETKNIKQNFFNLKANESLINQQIKNLQLDAELKNIQKENLTIQTAISQLDLNAKTALEQVAFQFGMPPNLLTPEMGFAALVAQSIGNATTDIFNLVAPIMEKIPLVGYIWNSISNNEKVQALNSVLGLVGAVFGIKFATIKLNKQGKAERDKTEVNETTTQTRQLPDGTILKQEIKTRN